MAQRERSNPDQRANLSTATRHTRRGYWIRNLGNVCNNLIHMTVANSFSDVAEKYPSAAVVGIDISPIQPVWVPPNCSFLVDNFENWAFKENKFDFIHIRLISGCVKDLQKLYRDAFRSLKPGGWLEHTEINNTPDGDCKHWRKYADYCQSAAEKKGRSFDLADKIEPCMRTAGFDALQTKLHSLPVWDGMGLVSPNSPRDVQIGYFHWIYLNDIRGRIAVVLGDTLGWSQEQIEVQEALMRRELRSSKVFLFSG